MSLAVIGYQIFIASLIIGAGGKAGKPSCILTAALASIWTLTHIIMPWLMILQFCTIAVATSIGLSIAKSGAADEIQPTEVPINNPSLLTTEQKSPAKSWVWLSLVVFILPLLVFLNSSDRSTQNAKTVTSKHVQSSPVKSSVSRRPVLPPHTGEGEKRSLVNRPNASKVSEAQQLLHELGYFDDSVDGVVGPITMGAISQFQQDEGLYPDGIIDDELLRQLRERSTQ